MIYVKKLVIIFVIFIVVACTPIKKLFEDKRPREFLFITAKQGDTAESLAKQYLGTENQAWKIKEFNGVRRISQNDKLIIPLKPWRRGGLTAQGYQLVPVFSYHNFSSGKSKNKLTVGSQRFAEQIRYLLNKQFHILTLDQFYAFLEFGQIPEKAVVITIDDGWTSSYKIAYPILKKYGLNAILFVPTNFIHRKSKKTLSWEKIRGMVSDQTINIQCHTKSHRDLTLIEPGQSYAKYLDSISHEIVSSRNKIKEKIGTRASALAYPYGRSNSVVQAILEKNDYKLGFTVNRAGNPFFVNNMRVHRAMIYGTFSMQRFSRELKVFQKDLLATVEPIDTMPVLASIDYVNPKRYIENKQWRTALLAWKLRREWLIINYNTAAKQETQWFKSSDLKNKLDLINAADRQIQELKTKLNTTADTYYKTSSRYRDTDKIRSMLLRTLLFNPNHQQALKDIKELSRKQELRDYSVASGDTMAKIAHKLYSDSSKSVLIPLFNANVKSNLELQPGKNLMLPTTAAIKASQVKTKCQVKLTKSGKKLAEEYYTLANHELSHDHIENAISHLETAVCLVPDLKKAQEMLDMLKML